MFGKQSILPCANFYSNGAFGKVKWWKVALIGGGFSVMIETLQFVLKRGFTEVDDVWHNVVGCVIGWGGCFWFVNMEEVKKKSILVDLTDAEFLAFLYSEREREKSMSQYQGWNLWALFGVIITVIIAGYQLLKDNLSTISWSQVMYLISGILAFVLCYRPVALFFGRERGVDARKLKTLKDVAPIVFLGCAILVSVCFSVLTTAFNKDPWFMAPIAWIISALLFIGCGLSVYINREKIVKSYLSGMLFTEQKWERRIGGLLGGSLSLTWFNSFKQISSPVIGTASFELAVCISSCVFLLYFLMKVYSSEKTTQKIDVLIDDYLYKNASKEAVYIVLRIGRMGNTVLESFSRELLDMRSSFEAYEQKKSRIQEIDDILGKDNVEAAALSEYLNEISDILNYLRKCNTQADILGDKLLQVSSQVPELKEDEEYDFLSSILDVLVNRQRELYRLTETVFDEMKCWICKYHCEKYGVLCEKECEHRNDRRLFRYRIVDWCRKKRLSIVRKCSHGQ